MKVILLITIFYVAPLLYNKWWYKQAFFNEKGRWTTLTPDFSTIYFTIFPFVNIITAIINVFDNWKHDKYIKNNWITKFFKL